jgi:hypothetical protein
MHVPALEQFRLQGCSSIAQAPLTQVSKPVQSSTLEQVSPTVDALDCASSKVVHGELLAPKMPT